VEQLQVSTAKSQIGKLKNLLGSKQQTEDTKKDISEIQTAPWKQELRQLGQLRAGLEK